MGRIRMAVDGVAHCTPDQADRALRSLLARSLTWPREAISGPNKFLRK
jgi:hypothetical protein